MVGVGPHQSDNPTGHVIPTEVLQEVADATATHNSTLIVDEVFDPPRNAFCA